ncbi:MAG: tRNA (adenosine(37)-N6)-threonylcarbamoyltransferase complex dimerization subunit type 1 TsaB [Flavobacteriaceae bacterium CG_4_8_14_3_um_filter_34_10]|nr:tRNA (adenosine(37)-N6)-threonylcarbamoyltransferase complex dimerization subunit type 1 TsaB [Flavobacteriia bacterium]PIV48550.1 MAG: tRNA (adenosine(37)-N6)-threonylcarbamoyltransferase complex dimerization subunit type 1 TsaB [Flavobacteriaceae bacterium CG02_land_8_20_14_3_00_34_13]PIX10032.1 MAG: tRNA (adenosine(37)-N6)-threonylcarbamoyltransferase complex dimerization subunit type 1 TsaB [Flavobacteriaceae bacterium CG_4_8_14_3_um_filter_34_10]
MTMILCIETSTTNCSVAIAKEGKVLAMLEDNEIKYSHAERLHHYIEQVLEEAKIKITNLKAIAISKGPGSYTGLRIGVSAAKGLCYALDIPLISIPTLQILALQADTKSDFIIPMLDARRMEVYSCVFNNKREQIREIKAEILAENSFMEYLNKGQVTFIGNANKKFKEVCSHKNAIYLDQKLPSSKEMCLLAASKYKKNDTENVAYFEPYYLKDFIGG